MYVYIAAMCLIWYVYAQSMWARHHPHFFREVERQAGEMLLLLLAACFAGRVLRAFRGSGHGGAERRQNRLLGIWGGVSVKGAAAVL